MTPKYNVASRTTVRTMRGRRRVWSPGKLGVERREKAIIATNAAKSVYDLVTIIVEQSFPTEE